MTDDWLEVAVDVAPEEVDRLSGALWAAGAVGIEERDSESKVRLVVALRADDVDALLAVLAPRHSTCTRLRPMQGSMSGANTPTRLASVAC